MRPTNSSSICSTVSASIVPSEDITHRDFAQFVVIEQAEDLAAVLLAERQHQHGGTFRAGELALTRVDLRPAGELGHQAANIVADLASCGGVGVRHGLGRVLVEPISDDGNRFVRVLFGQFADFLHRYGVDLALHLGDVDHGRGAV